MEQMRLQQGAAVGDKIFGNPRGEPLAGLEVSEGKWLVNSVS